METTIGVNRKEVAAIMEIETDVAGAMIGTATKPRPEPVVPPTRFGRNKSGIYIADDHVVGSAVAQVFMIVVPVCQNAQARGSIKQEVPTGTVERPAKSLPFSRESCTPHILASRILAHLFGELRRSGGVQGQVAGAGNGIGIGGE